MLTTDPPPPHLSPRGAGGLEFQVVLVGPEVGQRGGGRFASQEGRADRTSLFRGGQPVLAAYVAVRGGIQPGGHVADSPDPLRGPAPRIAQHTLDAVPLPVPERHAGSGEPAHRRTGADRDEDGGRRDHGAVVEHDARGPVVLGEHLDDSPAAPQVDPGGVVTGLEHARHFLSQHSDHGEGQRVDHRHRNVHPPGHRRGFRTDESGTHDDQPSAAPEGPAQAEGVRQVPQHLDTVQAGTEGRRMHRHSAGGDHQGVVREFSTAGETHRRGIGVHPHGRGSGQVGDAQGVPLLLRAQQEPLDLPLPGQ
ncbi:hypothetical protein PV383_17190 [Streptomyces caniscabiei]|uniref:Uncharacterized protein n=1 Tax=Streptomyces caniscabiei TaxID=2746961 RepID=A0ABU4MQ34_9ACTN|nr:hypothetical protein [Streptomyces caniscabiei]MDX2955459.1 hypothetical protein [Streptomyces caniscabiei]MDX3038897.1 hypothetical protein [Streptomyces caniscabiei]